MNLFDRDYTVLLPDEEQRWEDLRTQEVVSNVGNLKIRRSRFRDYPKAARHFSQLFPNNYLDIVELTDEPRLSEQLASFEALLNANDVNERQILNFIIKRQAYFLVGSILKAYFPFGHHDAYLFPEFPLGSSFKVDHLLIGKNSAGWHFVFVELEAPAGSITLADGNLGEAFRKGIAQTRDWEAWLDARYPSLLETFEKAKRPDRTLPCEFGQLDRSRVHFVVVAGRRKDFNDKTYRVCRKEPQFLIHYDNVVDASRELIGQMTY